MVVLTVKKVVPIIGGDQKPVQNMLWLNGSDDCLFYLVLS